MSMHVYMQQSHLTTIKYLTLLMFNKQKLQNHQPLVRPENENDNILPTPTQLAHMLSLSLSLSHK